MPTMVVDTPLGLSCVFSDGSRAEFDLDEDRELPVGA